MIEFITKLSPDGRILIPANCRKALHLKSGEQIVIRIEDDKTSLITLSQSIKKAQDTVRKYNKKKLKLSEELIKERRREAKNE